MIRKSKKSYYQSFFAEYNTNIKKVWEGIKELVNIKKKNIITPTSIEIDNSCTSDPKLICNSFNNYFVNIADDILKTRKFDGKKSYTEYLNNPVPNTWSGPNGIPTKILQMMSKEISPPLSKITHPEKLKLVNVLPIYKKGSRLLISNYRPISLLSNLNKIFEKIIFKRVYNFIEKNEILYPLQYGFRSIITRSRVASSLTCKKHSIL